MLRVGPTEMEREQVLGALRSGRSFEAATAELRKSVEADWFERNEKHLLEVAAKGEKKAPLVELAKQEPEPVKGARK